MPTTVNFSSLIADMQNYLERGGSVSTDPTVFNQLPRLINAAERKLAQVLKLLGQWEVLVDAPAGLQAANSVVMKPDRWRHTISINYGTGASKNGRVQLFPRSYEYCRNYWPDSTLTDPENPPAFYSDYSYQAWLIVPTPDQDYPAEFNCYMQPPLLDATQQENFWSNYCPNALLYGALLEAEPFLKEDSRIPVWQQMWQQEIQTLSGQDIQRLMDRNTERNRP